ncbi:MAG: GNAT family N-acetyltransferase [Acidimicrobiales bacterium]
MAKLVEEAGRVVAATDVPELPAAYPRRAERVARIRDGRRVQVRPIRPDDVPMLVAFRASLSPQSDRQRSSAHHPVLSMREADRFARVDYFDRLVLIVLVGDRIAGLGRYDRIGSTDEAEVAIVVEDDCQRQGIGTLLADELARVARVRGMRLFVADSLAGEMATIEMLRSTGFPVESRFVEGVVKSSFPIEPAPGYLDALARREAARLVDRGNGAGWPS